MPASTLEGMHRRIAPCSSPCSSPSRSSPRDRRRTVGEPDDRGVPSAPDRPCPEPGADPESGPHDEPGRARPRRTLPAAPDPAVDPAPNLTSTDAAPAGAPDPTGRFIVMLRNDANTASVVDKVRSA